MRRYYTTAAAKMVTERFGADLGKFLSVADKADPADLIDLLQESVGCRQATSAAHRSDGNPDESQSCLSWTPSNRLADLCLTVEFLGYRNPMRR